MKKINRDLVPGIILGILILVFIIISCANCSTRYSDKYKYTEYESNNISNKHDIDTCIGLDITKIQKAIFFDDFVLIKYDNIFIDCSFDNLYKIIEVKYTLSMITSDGYKERVIREFAEEMSVCYDKQRGIYSVKEN